MKFSNNALLFSLLVLSACSTATVPPLSDVKVIAHGGGAAHWIRNSRNAAQQLVAAKLNAETRGQFDGIEVDIVLTADNVPILAHDPWVSTDLCESDTRELSSALLIKNILKEELVSEFSCGGVSDPDHPSAEIHSESILDFEEFLTIVGQTPELLVYLDLKIQLPLTKAASDYAEAILTLWKSANTGNPLMIEVPDKESATYFNAWRDRLEFELVLSYPPYYAGENWTLVGAVSAWQTFWRKDRPVEFALDSNADSISSLMSLLPTTAVRALQNERVGIVAFTARDYEQLHKDCLSGASIVITDVPLSGPCP